MKEIAENRKDLTMLSFSYSRKYDIEIKDFTTYV